MGCRSGRYEIWESWVGSIGCEIGLNIRWQVQVAEGLLETGFASLSSTKA